MSIEQMQKKLARLHAKIEVRQMELADLKSQRQVLKDHIAELKKAAREGKLVPEPPGLGERIGAKVNETVLRPLGLS